MGQVTMNVTKKKARPCCNSRKALNSQLHGSIDDNSTLFSLVHLRSLDLSDNDFNRSRIPHRLGEFSKLMHLNLSHGDEITFSGQVPPQLSHLSNLLSLDLRSYTLGPFPDVPTNPLQLEISTLRALIRNSTRLKQLRLNCVSISSPVPDTFTNLTSLQKLSLRQCELYGEFPIGIFHLPNLRSLNLGYNQNLKGTLPSSIGNLTNLVLLALEDNSFYGEIPHSLFRLENLEYFSLWNNFFEGELALEMFLKLKHLSTLDLSDNKFSLLTAKNVVVNATTLPPIQWLGLGSCNLTGEIPTWIMNLTSLIHLNLDDNQLHGEIPQFLFKLENLETLNLSENLLEGQIELGMLLNLKRLNALGLGGSGNRLTFLERNITSNNMTFSQIKALNLASCNLVLFPNFIQHLQELTDLYIPDNSINTVPSWMWNKTSLMSLVISNNALIGEISPLICNSKSLVRLDLSYNNLVGKIPSCLGGLSQSLHVLNLRGNNLSGHIPQTFMVGTALRIIDFSYNNLHGSLPRELVKCRMLEFLDVSHNHFNDSFPFWLGYLPELKVINLSENKFHGSIKCQGKCTFPKLHIIDLSHNDFSGNLPSELIEEFKSMITSNASQEHFKNNIYYGQNCWYDLDFFLFTMASKGVVRNYTGFQYLHYMVAIDLSCNKFYGEIPEIMGSLKSLVMLNLSNNMLTGSIPSSLGKLSNLEVLDLSLNSLLGKIPQQLTELTFLDFFNVSFNNLSGPIPESRQFSTFESKSFEGNQGLCGIQLVKKCQDHSRPPLEALVDGAQDTESGFFFEFNWSITVIGYVGGLVAGLALGNTFAPDVVRIVKRIPSLIFTCM
ncbi:hypothetical protein PIB30_053980 [Stylosanthes scabra]|uniref:Disease resistance R13L4/SHOC-2-like LRR domain-containing protein n=1 Tax=Stylosanthes scabra TaxID=79078 RepID=A0ABU6QJ35_9FABA|nr:hypothetical protein [Stylosanthes scabra]